MGFYYVRKFLDNAQHLGAGKRHSSKSNQILTEELADGGKGGVYKSL